jgi:chromosomal replication initiation ATPase DnaA
MLPRPTPAQVLEVVSQVFRIPAPAIVSASRRRPHVHARRALALLLREELELSLEEVGQELGGRHYSTAFHAIETARGAIPGPYDLEARRRVQELLGKRARPAAGSEASSGPAPAEAV